MTYEEVKIKHYMELDTMEREEAEWIIEYNKRWKCRMSWSEALEAAKERIQAWITEADEEQKMYLSYSVLARCASSWRRTKIWATFIGRA